MAQPRESIRWLGERALGRPRPTRWLVAAMCALLAMLFFAPTAAAAPTAPVAVPAATALVPPPDQDPFYAVPGHLNQVPDGTVLASRRVQAMALAVPIPANAWQVKYKTIDQRGRPSAFVTTVLVPLTPWQGGGARPLLSYQVAMDALSTTCAPSFVMRAGLAAATTAGPTVLLSNAASETINIVQALQRGFTVAVPDFEGPKAEWLGAEGAARGVLDGIRAVRNFQPAGAHNSAPIGLAGYSGGALATDWAMQMQLAYAPELHFVGAALGGTPASLKGSIAAFAASPIGRGAVPLLLAALQRSYPQRHIEQYLSAAGRAAVANSQQDCLIDALIKNDSVDPTTYEAYPGALFNNPRIDPLYASVSPLDYPGKPRTPILFYHALADEFAPIGYMRELAARYCGEGLPVHVATLPFGEHILDVFLGFPTALNYIADRFAGAPAPNDC